jgi:hypothetical protein
VSNPSAANTVKSEKIAEVDPNELEDAKGN